MAGEVGNPDTLATQINAEHSAVERDFRSGVEHARRAGELLIQARRLVVYGEWLPWLTANCTVSERTAQAYMRVARHYAELAARNPQRVADLSFREGLKLLAEPAGDGSVHFSSSSPEWYTPPEIVERVLLVLGTPDVDPCSDGKTIPARTHLTKADDGLSQPWHGKVYMNPPYGREIEQWVDKLMAEHAAGLVIAAIALVPARTDTEWFRKLQEDFPVCFISGRLKFSGHHNSAPFPSAAVYLGKDPDRFRVAFSTIGVIAAAVRDNAALCPNCGASLEILWRAA